MVGSWMSPDDAVKRPGYNEIGGSFNGPLNNHIEIDS